MLAGKQGWVLDPAAAALLVKIVLGIAGAYIVSQGVADWGKESAKVHAAAAALLETAKKAPEPAEKTEPEILTEEI
jgi:hypothetical protein